MPAQDEELTRLARERGLLTESQLEELRTELTAESSGGGSGGTRPTRRLADLAVEKGMLTQGQADEVLQALLPRNAPRQLGRYRVLELLGKGGMGAVYRGRDPNLKRLVAIKTLRSELAANEDFIARFRREAQLAAQFKSPHVVRVHDQGHEGTTEYIVMEFVEGEDLAQVLAREGKLEEKRACAICADVVRALQEAQKHSIIHRDIKPHNIMIDAEDGAVKLADLGIGKQLFSPDDDEASKQLSLTVGVIGTPQYMSPEQAMGETDLDFRSDVFSLGATLYHLVCGRLPYQGRTPQMIMVKVAHDPPPDPLAANPDLSRATVAVIRKMMARDRTRRYVSLDALLTDLECVAQGIPPTVVSEEPAPVQEEDPQAHWPTTRALPVPPPRRWPIAAAAALVLLLAGGGLAWYLGTREQLVSPPSPISGGPQQPRPKRVTREDAANTILDQAKALAAEKNYTEAIARLDSIIYKYSDTKPGPQAETLKAEYQAAITAAEQLERQVTEAFNQARVEEQTGLVQQAIDTLGQILPRAPDNQQLRNDIARLRKKQRDKQTVAEREASYKKFYDAGFICEAQKNWDGAVEVYEEAQKYKDTSEVKDRLAEVQHNSWLQKARREYDLEKRVEMLTKALSYKRVPETEDFMRKMQAAIQRRKQRALVQAEFDKWMAKAADAEKEKDFETAKRFYGKATEFAKELGEGETARIEDALNKCDKEIARIEQERRKEAERIRLAGLKTQRDKAVADGNRLLGEQRWKEAAAAFGDVLKIQGYDKDREAQEGIAKATGGLDAFRKRTAYEDALKQAQAAYQRARGTKDEALWQAVKDAAERAVQSGHTDTGEAGRLLAEAEKHFSPPWPPGWTAEKKVVKVATPHGDVQKEITYWTNTIGMKFVLIQSGQFMMRSEQGASDEKSVHRMRIEQPFYLGAHEVTNGQWKQFIRANAQYNAMADSDGEYGKHLDSNGWNADTEPMVYVSWKNAQKFCEWLSTKEDITYRLPTEAEWEYACRAGSRTSFYWGEHVRDDCAWYDSNSERKTHPVGEKLPNAFGLYDMSGNVWEWCQSLYKQYPYRADDGREDLRAAGSRVLRGGSWCYGGFFIRSANRLYGDPASAYYFSGFRVVVSLPGVL